jgi:hypothetical protein
MSKVSGGADPYVAFSFVTGDDIVKHFGVSAVTALPTNEQQRYNDYALQANKATETVIYKYVDELPLDSTDEARTYAIGMAFYYALWLKQADDGAVNTASMKGIWEGLKEDLIKTLKSQPKSATTRTVVSNAYPDQVVPYSQSYGLSDIL